MTAVRYRFGPSFRSWLVLASMVIMSLIGVGTLAAFAQEAVTVSTAKTAVTVEWGDMLAVFITNLLANPDSAAMTVVLGIVGTLLLKLPAPLRVAYNMFRVEQLLRNAIAGAANSTAGAVEGKALTVDVGGEVLAKALNYAVDNGNKALIEWMGGKQGIQDKLIARIPMAATVDGAALVEAAKTATKTLTGK